jgi:aspartate carbamoyltransferase catalytic subunit
MALVNEDDMPHHKLMSNTSNMKNREKSVAMHPGPKKKQIRKRVGATINQISDRQKIADTPPVRKSVKNIKNGS